MNKIDLPTLPKGAINHNVVSAPVLLDGTPALRVTLTERARTGVFGVDHADEPTFVMLPIPFQNGVIEVDVQGRLLPDAPDFARGFIGLAYRISPGLDQYESVYLRPTNGLAAPPPRNARAVQYYAYPDWKFDRLRAEHPDGLYESAADIHPGIWARLRLEIKASRLRAFVDGRPCLDLEPTKLAPSLGWIGLWVDIGTEGFFANLSITPA